MYQEEGEVVALLRVIARNTRDIADLVEVGYGSQLRRMLAPILGDAKKRAAYEASSGELSSREVGKIAGVSHKTVRDWWKEWSGAGLLRPTAVEGRYARKYDLDRLALAEDA